MWSHIKLKPANRPGHPSERSVLDTSDEEQGNENDSHSDSILTERKRNFRLRNKGVTKMEDDTTKSIVWIKDRELVFIKAEVVSEEEGDSNGMIIVKPIAQSSGNIKQLKVRKSETLHYSPSLRGNSEEKMDDLSKLGDLHEAALLHTLHSRFRKDIIYTYTGPILIAINPFKKIDIYQSKQMELLQEKTLGDVLRPHIYSIAHKAFLSMVDNNGRNQSILVSGESGAGKTVSTKHVMDYLTYVSRNSKISKVVCARVLQINPLLEAFGNAKTTRNDNSSRFGKLIQMQFEHKSYETNLIGAFVDIYLLEKARVTHLHPGERNFHIFYELIKGTTAKEKAKWNISSFIDLDECYFTSQSKIRDREDLNDEDQFQNTLKAMDIVGINDDIKQQIFRCVVAIMHLGNVEFEEDEKGETIINPKTYKHFATCCELLLVSEELLEKVFLSRKINVGNGTMKGNLSKIGKLHTVAQAIEARNALAMTLYERMFLWLVWKCNQSIATAGGAEAKEAVENLGKQRFQRVRNTLTLRRKPKNKPVLNIDVNATFASSEDEEERLPSGNLSLNSSPGLENAKETLHNDFTIGCLDIFGFEVFEENSFEQLCINFANEVLQQQFNGFVFELEQQLYEAECITWKNIAFPDNSDCIRLIKGRLGVFSIINEECLLSGSDQSLYNKMLKTLSGSNRFEAGKHQKVKHCFNIKHFAGVVQYNVAGFYRKNKNELREEAVTFVRSSDLSLIRILLPENAASSPNSVVEFDSYFSKVCESLDDETPKPDKRTNESQNYDFEHLDDDEKTESDEPSKKKSLVASMKERIESRRFESPYGSSTKKRQVLAGSLRVSGSYTSSKIQQQTVGSYFLTQLDLAMAHINASQPHYVRCIKSNDKNVKDILDRQRTLEQLNYSGVLEVIRVARAGYPTRFSFQQFVDKFEPLMQEEDAWEKGIPAQYNAILTFAKLRNPNDYQIGRTMIFLKAHAYTTLEKLKEKTVPPESQKSRMLRLAKKKKWVKDKTGKLWRFNKNTDLWEEFTKYKKLRNPFTHEPVFEPMLESAKAAAKGFMPEIDFNRIR